MNAMKKLAVAAIAAILTGCAAPTAVPITAPAVQAASEATPAHAQAIDRGVARHLLDTSAKVDGGSRIWGLRYNSTQAQLVSAREESYCNGPNGSDHFYTPYMHHCYELLGWTVDWNHAEGAGEFEPLGHHGVQEGGWLATWNAGERFTFVVPDGLYLVIHEMGGSMSINGFQMTTTERTVDYLFTDGERVMFHMQPGAWVSGVVCDPELAVPGARAKTSKSAK